MKYRIIILSTIFLAIVSCTNNNNEGQLMSLQNEIDSLKNLSTQKDSAVSLFFQTISEIENNLNIIKEKEGIIDIEKNKEMSGSQKDKINRDILNIYELIQQNKTKLKTAQSRLNSSQVQIAELNKLIERLNYQVAVKDSNIAYLRHNLSKLDLLIDSLFQNIDSLYFENELKDEIIDFQRTKLNKAYYVIGNKKELTEHEIINNKGGFVGLKRIKQLKNDFNKNHFSEIDITRKMSFPILSEKFEVITNHPTDSYEMYGENPIDSLVITDIEAFWSISKYLVIVIE